MDGDKAAMTGLTFTNGEIRVEQGRTLTFTAYPVTINNTDGFDILGAIEFKHRVSWGRIDLNINVSELTVANMIASRGGVNVIGDGLIVTEMFTGKVDGAFSGNVTLLGNALFETGYKGGGNGLIDINGNTSQILTFENNSASPSLNMNNALAEVFVEPGANASIPGILTLNEGTFTIPATSTLTFQGPSSEIGTNANFNVPGTLKAGQLGSITGIPHIMTLNKDIEVSNFIIDALGADTRGGVRVNGSNLTVTGTLTATNYGFLQAGTGSINFTGSNAYFNSQ